MSDVIPAGDIGAKADNPNQVTPTPNADPVVKAEERAPVVPRETYEKLLKEKKNYSLDAQAKEEKIKELERQVSEVNDARLKEKEDWKSLYEQASEKLKTTETVLATKEHETVNGIKQGQLRKELEKMGAGAKSMDLILGKLADLEALKYDADHRIVLGVEDEARRIKEQLPELFGRSTVGVGHEAPQGAPTNIDVEGYQKMSLKDKNNPEIIRALYAKHGIALK